MTGLELMKMPSEAEVLERYNSLPEKMKLTIGWDKFLKGCRYTDMCKKCGRFEIDEDSTPYGDPIELCYDCNEGEYLNHLYGEGHNYDR